MTLEISRELAKSGQKMGQKWVKNGKNWVKIDKFPNSPSKSMAKKLRVVPKSSKMVKKWSKKGAIFDPLKSSFCTRKPIEGHDNVTYVKKK